jgi:hypothetical protein
MSVAAAVLAMSADLSREEIERLRRELAATAEIADLTEQMMEVAAIVEEALAPLGIHPVVVGGLAVAYWLPGAYLTGDIDVVMPYTKRGNERLADLGFEQEGRSWKLSGRQIFFEAPGSTLEPVTEGYEVVELASGRRVRVQAAHEVLIVRMHEFVGTGHSDVFQQCLWLLGAAGLDRAALEMRVSEEGLAEALEVLDGYAEDVRQGRKLPEPWELKELAARL